MSMFRLASSPSPDLETCKSCDYIATCNGCFAKAFRVSEVEYPDCPWRHEYFPGMDLEATLPPDVSRTTSRIREGRTLELIPVTSHAGR
jgi:hypothetical protein